MEHPQREFSPPTSRLDVPKLFVPRNQRNTHLSKAPASQNIQKSASANAFPAQTSGTVIPNIRRTAYNEKRTLEAFPREVLVQHKGNPLNAVPSTEQVYERCAERFNSKRKSVGTRRETYRLPALGGATASEGHNLSLYLSSHTGQGQINYIQKTLGSRHNDHRLNKMIFDLSA